MGSRALVNGWPLVAGQLAASSAPPVVVPPLPTTVPTSASSRVRTASVVNGVTSAQAIQTYRMLDVPLQSGVNPFIDYWNGWVNAGITAAGQEVYGSFVDLTAYVVTNVQMSNGAALLNQTGATITPFPWGGAGTVLRKGSYGGASSSSLTTVDMAQFTADGGAINGATITVPPGYLVTSDPAASVSLPAGVPYLLQVEDKREPQKSASDIASVTNDGAGLVTVTFNTPRRSVVGEYITTSGFTTSPGSYNTTQGFRILSATPTVITFSVPGTTTAPTAIGNIFATRPQHANIRKALGDAMANNALGGHVGILNWVPTNAQGATVNTNAYLENATGGCISALRMTDPTGLHGFVHLDGSSLEAGKQDGQLVSGAPDSTGGAIVGDAYGRYGYAARGAAAAGYPHIITAIGGINCTSNVLYNDFNARCVLGRGARIAYMGEIHNTILTRGTTAQTVSDISFRTGKLKAQTPGLKIMLPTTTPTTTAGTSNNWATRAGQVQSGAYIYPTGIAYLYNADLLAKSGVWASNPPDGVFDMALATAQMDGGAIDGNWPADGTSWRNTTDGVHGAFPWHTFVGNKFATALTSTFGTP